MTTHCCEAMVKRLTHDCDLHPDPYDCPDAVVVFEPRQRAYGLPVHDGGSSYLAISHCPWCGSRLPQTVEEEWEAAVRARDLNPDSDDDLPADLAWDTWTAAHQPI